MPDFTSILRVTTPFGGAVALLAILIVAGAWIAHAHYRSRARSQVEALKRANPADIPRLAGPDFVQLGLDAKKITPEDTYKLVRMVLARNEKRGKHTAMIALILTILFVILFLVGTLLPPKTPPTPVPTPLPTTTASSVELTTACCGPEVPPSSPTAAVPGVLICPPERLKWLLSPGASVTPSGSCDCSRKPCCTPPDADRWVMYLTAIAIHDMKNKDIRSTHMGSQVCLRPSAPGTTKLPSEDCVSVADIAGVSRKSILATTAAIVRNGIDVIIRDNMDRYITQFNGKARGRFSPNLVCNEPSAGFQYPWDDSAADMRVNVIGYLEKP